MTELSLPRILLPVDFSERSTGAARQAKMLAASFQSEVHVLHVLDLRTYGMLGPGFEEGWPGEPTLRTAAEKELENFVGRELAGVQVQTAFQSGDPAREIVKYARRQDISLIVLPTHGFGPFRRLMLGSVTSKVLHDCDCPVWTGVHMENPPLAGPERFDNIVCAIDLEEHSLKPLTWAWLLGKKFGSRVTVVHAIPALATERPAYFNGKWQEYLVNQAKEQIQQLQSTAGTSAEVSIRPGEIDDVVAAAAKELRADVAVIGRGAAAGFAGRLRTYSYAIIRESPCPVVSV